MSVSASAAAAIAKIASALGGIKDSNGDSLLKKAAIVVLCTGCFMTYGIGLVYTSITNPAELTKHGIDPQKIINTEKIETPQIGGALYPLPTYQSDVSNHYGSATDYYFNHSGVDFAVPENTKICSITDGKVVSIGHADKAFGNWILIMHQRRILDPTKTTEGMDYTEFDEIPEECYITITFYSFYAHLNKIVAIRGQEVSKRQIIALSGGSTKSWFSGNTTGPHLHFEIRKGESLITNVNPIEYIGVM